MSVEVNLRWVLCKEEGKRVSFFQINYDFNEMKEINIETILLSDLTISILLVVDVLVNVDEV